MRRQLRPFYSPEDLAGVYDHVYEHQKWPDHIERVGRTVDVALALTKGHDCFTRGMDLSCGDGAILRSVMALGGVSEAWYGDLVPAEHLNYVGRIEDTTNQALAIFGEQSVDLFICSETLEHVEDPDYIIRQVRRLARFAIFTTPIDETEAQGNQEHYWAWGVEDVEQMLRDGGFTDLEMTRFDSFFYNFQIWTAS